MELRKRRFSYVGILDLYPGAVAAWSPFPLSAAMLGQPLFSLREDNDDTVDDFSKSTLTAPPLNGSGQTVAQWLTASGATNPYWAEYYPQAGSVSLVQTTNGNQPLYVDSGGVQSAQYNGSSSFMVSDANVSMSTFSAFSVFTASAASMIYEQSTEASANNGCFLVEVSGDAGIVATRAAASSGRLDSAIGLSGFGLSVFRHSFDGTHAGHTLRRNGVAYTGSDWISAANPGTGTIENLIYVGARAGSSLFSALNKSTLLIFSPKLSSEDEATVEALLQAMHGVA